MHRIPLLVGLFLVASPFLFSDDIDSDTYARILKDAVSISVHSEIVQHDNEKYWQSDVNKITIPGRTVTLLFQTENEKLTIELTPFIADDNTYTLVAVSKFWHQDEKGAQFRTSFKSIKLMKGEQVLFYPLGLKTQEALTGGSLFMEMGIKIAPYKVEINKTEE